MKVLRKELLNSLLAITPGVAKREILQQSSCVILRQGRFYSLSQEVACCIPSGLPKEWEAAVNAEKLIDLLDNMPEEEVEVNLDSKIISIKGKRKLGKLSCEEEIVLPVEEVELPIGKVWESLSEPFSEALELVYSCTHKRDDFIKECIHLHPQWLEASDNTRMIRYTMPTFVKESVLVRGESIKPVAQLGMTRGAETRNWLHFRNPLGLRVSVRKFLIDDYPPLDQFLNLRGKKVSFPKGLAQAASTAGLFAAEDDAITVTVSNNRVLVEGKDPFGSYSEEKKSRYTGPVLSFRVPHKLFAELVNKHEACEVTDCSLRCNGGKWIYCCSLEVGK